MGPTTAYLALLRLPVAVTNSIAVAIAYPLLCRLVGARVALLAALMLATSPFLIGFSRVLHVDGLLTSFSMLSILLLLVATNEGRRMDGGDGAADRAPVVGRWWLVGSGVCAGLAALSKAPALVLLPWAGLLLLFTIGGAEWRRSRTSTAPARWAPAIGRVIGLYLLWLGCAVLMFFALWPAMWVAPLDTFADVVREIFLNGGEPHAAGNYFLGEAVPDPGWRFYPVAALLRSTPVMLPGLLALPFAFWGPGSRAPERRVALALLSFAVLFTVAVSFAAKKFDRYMLPAWPALEIAAAIGLAGLGRWVTGFLGRSTRRAPARWPDVAAILAIGALLFAIDMWYHPYEIAYYNPLLGGGATAERIILVGWGEGLEDVGAWLRQRPDLERAPVLSWIPPTLSPFLPRSVQVLDIREETVALRSPAPLYAVLYTRAAARAEAHGPEVYIRQTPPLFTVRKYGITYATVHQLPRPYDTAVNALFGDGLALRGYGEQRIAGTLTISPSWDVRRDQPGGLNVFVHVLAADGRRVAQVDAPIDDGLYPTWQAGQQFGTPLPIALPRDLPA
ncbi:MAG TPA: glycosyltransferase family 39 protein, partial [Roseiflexaceae bacterium]